MSKIIIVSNRLPIKIQKNKNSYDFINSSGGVATGMDSIHSKNETLSIGWPGIALEELNDEILKDINQAMDPQKLENLVVRLESAVKALESKGLKVDLPTEVRP